MLYTNITTITTSVNVLWTFVPFFYAKMSTAICTFITYYITYWISDTLSAGKLYSSHEMP